MLFANQGSRIDKNLIASMNVADLKEQYNLEYILPKNISANTQKSLDAAVFIHLFYEDLVDICFSYIKEACAICEVYITTSKMCIKDYRS